MKPVNERIKLLKNLCELVKEHAPDIAYLGARYSGDCDHTFTVRFYNLYEFTSAETFHKLPHKQRKSQSGEIMFCRFRDEIELPDWCNTYPDLVGVSGQSWSNMSYVFDAVLEDFLPENSFKEAGCEGMMIFSISEQKMQHYHVKRVITEEIQHISYEAATLRPVPTKTTKTITKPIRKVKS